MTDCEPIPFLDLVSPHRELENELLEGVRRALRSATFIGGPVLAEFEESFAAFCQTRFCVGVGSGTDALRFAIMAAGIGAGDSVITVPNTFIATAEAISSLALSRNSWISMSAPATWIPSSSSNTLKCIAPSTRIPHDL